MRSPAGSTPTGGVVHAPARAHRQPTGPGQSTGFTAAGMAHYGTTTLDPVPLQQVRRHHPGRANSQYVWLDDPNGARSFPLPTPDRR